MPEFLTMAIVGCGGIARRHLDGIRTHAQRIRVTAAIDADRARAEKCAAETGGAAYASLDEALAHGGFDAVDILLPHDLHESTAIACLAAGRHVLLEKPMAPTLAACDRILAAARAAGTVFMVAENAEYWPEVVRAHELIVDGAIGEVVTARAAFVLADAPLDGPRPWRYERSRSGGGIAMDGGAHWIRPLRMWLGEIDAVVAVIGRPIAAMEGESLARALFRFRSGICASFDAMTFPTFYAPENLWRVSGTKGELVVGSRLDGALRLYDASHPDGVQVMHSRGYADSFGLELEDFAAAVLDGRALKAGPEHSLGELRTALAMYRSAASGRWESVWG